MIWSPSAASVSELGADLGHGHGLALVGRILVGCELDVCREKLLEDYQALAAKAGAVEGDLHCLGAIGLIRGEGSAAGHLPLYQAVLDHDGLPGLGVDQGRLKRVLGAGDEALVGHLVDHGDLGSGHQLVAVGLVGGGGADVEEVHGLVLVIDIGMHGDLDAVGGHGLEGDDVLAREQAGVEG